MDAMDRCLRALARVFVIAAASALLLPVGSAAAATACAQQVIDDWSDNGRIDSIYQLQCYEEAIDAIPVDIRDYTSAADVINRALTAALRSDPNPPGGDVVREAASPEVDTSGASSFPTAMLMGGGAALGLLAAGAASHVARRRRGPDA